MTYEEALQDWRQTVQTASPTANPDYVRKLADIVVGRAFLLSQEHGLSRPEVAAFLLERTRDWVLGGLAITAVHDKLPKTLGDLGLLKIAEGGKDGSPLPLDSLKDAIRRPTVRIIQ